jgi:hypothetical protein
MLRGDPFSRVSTAVIQVLHMLQIRHPTEWARPFWESASEFASFFIKGDRNAIIRATREAHVEDPASIPGAAADARLMTTLMAHFVPWVRDARSLVGVIPGFTETQAIMVDRYFLPMIAGMLLHLRDFEYTKTMRAELRAGNYEKMLPLGQIKDILPVLRERLGAA